MEKLKEMWADFDYKKFMEQLDNDVYLYTGWALFLISGFEGNAVREVGTLACAALFLIAHEIKKGRTS